MCFTPAISLTSAIIEFALAAVMIFFFKKSKLKNFLTVFIILLGLYQISEFMLCTSSSPKFWAAFGFLIYLFLPALGLHSALFFTNRKRNLFLLYVIPIVASIIVFSIPNFITVARCDGVFIYVSTAFTISSSLPFAIFYYLYVAYYFIFLISIGLVLLYEAKKRENKLLRQMNYVFLIGIGLAVLPTFVLLVLFPSIRWNFPSVLCAFAIFMAIAMVFAMYLKDRN